MMMHAAKKIIRYMLLTCVLSVDSLVAMESLCSIMGWDDDERWAEETFFDRLAQQDFVHIINPLYRFVDEGRNADVEAWITRQADVGHVPMLYMDARRLLKIADAEMRAEQRVVAFRQMCIALLRTAQDAACCTLISGRAESQDAYSVLQRKFYRYFLSGHVASRWPNYADVFAAVNTWFGEDGRIGAMPSPAWCCCCGWRTLSLTTVVFGTPDAALLTACNRHSVRVLIDAMRTEVYAKAQTVLRDVHNWEDFFQLPVLSFFPDGDDDGGDRV